MFEMPCHLCCHNHVDYSLTDCAKCIPIKAKKKTVDEKTVAVYSVRLILFQIYDKFIIVFNDQQQTFLLHPI